MDKTEILNIVNEPTKHIQLVKIDGKDSIVYSSKFVELLELIPTMLTKADMVAILDKIRAEIESNMESIIGKYDSSIPKSNMPSYKIERNKVRKECISIIDKYR